jgi:uncharacterized membrane protein YedE/YeeE
MFPHIFMGTLREHYILLFGAAGSFAAIIAFTAAWLGAQFGGRRAARRAAEEALAKNRAALDDSLGTLVQAVDAIALEVERLSEGQRFTARLLSDRGPMVPAARADNARVITPH